MANTKFFLFGARAMPGLARPWLRHYMTVIYTPAITYTENTISIQMNRLIVMMKNQLLAVFDNTAHL